MLSRKELETISAEITTTKVLPLWPLMYGHASLNHLTNLSCSFSVEEEAVEPQLQTERTLREFVGCLLFRLERGIVMWFLLKVSPPVVPAKGRGGLAHEVAAMRERETHTHRERGEKWRVIIIQGTRRVVTTERYLARSGSEWIACYWGRRTEQVEDFSVDVIVMFCVQCHYVNENESACIFRKSLMW